MTHCQPLNPQSTVVSFEYVDFCPKKLVFCPKNFIFRTQPASFEKSKCSLWLVYTGTTVTLQNDAMDAPLFSFALVGHKILNYFWLVERIVPPQKVVFFFSLSFLKWNWDRNGCLKDQPSITSAKDLMGASRKLPVILTFSTVFMLI